MSVELRQERHGGVLVLSPCGRLDNDSAADFELAVQELLSAGERHLVLDLAALNYISNAGLRVLASTAKALNAPSTSLRLAGLSPALRQVFDAAGFSPMFDLHPDLRTALARHPAASGADLGALAARLLGCAAGDPGAVAPAGTDPARLAALALELLSGTQAPRAARALAGGTRMVPRVQAPLAAPAAAPAAPSWWKRLLGGRSRP